MMKKNYQTQWAAQFYTAAELTRRGYLATFTLGNAPEVDLLCASPSGRHFSIDVKGLSSKNFWLIREREPHNDLYYVLVYLPPNFENPQYFILHSKVLMKKIAGLKKLTLANGKRWVDSGSGINWGMSLEHQNAWDVFPK